MSGTYSAFKFNEEKLNNKSSLLTYGDLSLYCNEFRIAIELFNSRLIKKSLHYFQLAYESVNRNDVYHNKYASYCGVARLLNGDNGGLELCREVAHSEIYDADVYLNLARAEWRFRNRKKTILALQKGLQIDSKHPGILKMREEMGVRRNRAIPVFKRDHAINNYLGKLQRKN